jgi:hypothetical protein
MSHYATEQSAYRVVISATGLGGAAPADGFIDNTTMEAYLTQGGSAPNITQTLAKERGNSRYEMMIWSSMQSFNYAISNIVATGGDSTTAPTAFQFDMTIERGDSVLYTADENNAGQFLTGVAALKRILARTLMIGRTDRTEYIDLTASNVPTGTQDNAGNSGVRRGNTIADVVIGALTSSLSTAESKITITAL